MGWRFRRSVKLFPGVRLNFTAHGLSTTIGVPGASINIGKSGPYLNLGLPGTGFSYRERLLPGRSPHQSSPAPLQSPPLRPGPVPAQPEVLKPGEIRSAPVSGMTSAGLEELKRLINEAAMRRVMLARNLAQSERQFEETKERLHKAQRFLVRLFMQKRIPRLTQEVQEANSKLAGERAELAACKIEIDFAFDDATLNAFAALVRTYESLRGCAAIWDITNSVVANRKVLRTVANKAVARTPVQLEFGSSNTIDSKYQALVLGNANGEDIYIYPGFVMMRSPGQDFALIDVRELVLEPALCSFHEEERVPSDSEVIGYTWARTNKDGSPDRRFRDNYQIPIVRYVELWFRSPTGLEEAYLFSNLERTKAFSFAFVEYQAALEASAERNKNNSPQDLPETWPAPQADLDSEIEEPPPEPVVNEKPNSLFFDWAALGVIGLALVSGIYFAGTHVISSGGLAAGSSTTPGPGMSVRTEPVALQSSVHNQKKLDTAATRQMVFVQSEGANVRAEPSMKAAILRTEPRGKQLAVFQRSGQWVQIGEAVPSGWIYADLLGPKAP